MQRWGWTLLDSLWQLAIIGLVTALVLQLLVRRTAAARYLVACGGLAAMVLAPLATYWLMPGVAASTPTPEPVATPSVFAGD